MANAPRVTMIGGGMITRIQLLPSIYQLQREGIVGEIHICDSRARPLIEATIFQPFMSVITLAARKQIGTAQAEQVRLEVAQSAFELSMDVAAAYYTVVADSQGIELLQQITEGTEAAAELAARQLQYF